MGKFQRKYLPKVGDTFGRLTIIGEEFYDANKRRRVPVLCECGAETQVLVNRLFTGSTKSCGCLHREFTAQLGRASAGKYLGPKSPRYKKGGKQDKARYIQEEKARPCTDCGIQYPPYCMEMDHVPERGPKLFTISLGTVSSKRTLEEWKEEKAKCDLVCAVCHNRRTWLRGRHGRVLARVASR